MGVQEEARIRYFKDKSFLPGRLNLVSREAQMQKIVVDAEPGIFFVVPISYLKFILDLRKSRVPWTFPSRSYRLITVPAYWPARQRTL